MTDHAPGFYLDPTNPELFREWADGHWTQRTRTGPGAPIVATMAPHVGQAEPTPGNKRISTPTAKTSAAPNTTSPINSALIAAILWAIAAAIIGAITITSAKTGEYGGDAYTDIQQTSAQTVRALGWLIIATGPLGLITALSRQR